MPTPAAHGGAQIVPINLTTPGFFGLNTEAEATALGPEWATKLTNVVFDSAGRISTRKGFSSGTTTPVAGIVKRIHEYIKADGTVELISSTDADIFKGITTPTSVEGTLAIAEGNINFVNFNDKCIALGTGTSSNPSVYTGTGNFTTITVNSGTAPTSGIGTAAFGRLWVVDSDGKTIKYCALLDETRWAVADGGGLFDMSKVWPHGQDVVKAIIEFAGDLVIFGHNNVVLVTDGAGNSLGIDPTVMYVSDTIPGVGCVSQFAITRALGDLWFMSNNGLQSLNRALQDKTTPTVNVSRNVQSKFLAYLDSESDKDDLSLVYSPREELVLAVFPTSDKVVAFDTRGQMQDGTFRATEWATDMQTCHYLLDRSLRASLTGVVGEIFQYTGKTDNAVSFSFAYESGWLNLGEQLATYLKYVKKLTSFVFVDTDTTINYTIKYDFKSTGLNVPVTATGGIASEFNVSEFSDSAAGIGYSDPNAAILQESEYSGGVALRTLSIPGGGGGQYIKVGVNLDTSTGSFALQQINLFAKVGRIAT